MAGICRGFEARRTKIIRILKYEHYAAVSARIEIDTLSRYGLRFGSPHRLGLKIAMTLSVQVLAGPAPVIHHFGQLADHEA